MKQNTHTQSALSTKARTPSGTIYENDLNDIRSFFEKCKNKKSANSSEKSGQVTENQPTETETFKELESKLSAKFNCSCN